MFLAVLSKYLNWKILTKNFVTFERLHRVNNENFEYYGGSQKTNMLGGGGGDCLKMGEGGGA